jgi:hypothetical protein
MEKDIILINKKKSFEEIKKIEGDSEIINFKKKYLEKEGIISKIFREVIGEKSLSLKKELFFLINE